MEAVSTASARLTRDGPDGIRSQLQIGGASGAVRGVRLEALFQLGPDDPQPGWLVVMTDDCPYEELLSISLTDTALRVQDQAEIGGAYAAGLWGGAQIAGPGALEFSFGTQAAPGRWRLQVLDVPRAGWPQRGVRRRNPLRQRFTLTPLR